MKRTHLFLSLSYSSSAIFLSVFLHLVFFRNHHFPILMTCKNPACLIFFFHLPTLTGQFISKLQSPGICR